MFHVKKSVIWTRNIDWTHFEYFSFDDIVVVSGVENA